MHGKSLNIRILFSRKRRFEFIIVMLPKTILPRRKQILDEVFFMLKIPFG